MLRGLESLHQLDMTRMLDRFDDVDLLHHLALCALLSHLIFVARFNGDELARQTVQT